jgi:hypothetical protein
MKIISKQYHLVSLFRSFCLLLIFSLLSASFGQIHAQGDCSRGSTNSPSSQTENLEQSVEDWGGYCERTPTWNIENVPSTASSDGALRCALTGGEPYSNIHCYRNLLAEPQAVAFDLNLNFSFPPTTCNNQGSDSTIQAIEFAMNKWQDGKRYEWALQWQNVGEGAPQWRYWDANQQDQWVPIGAEIEEICLSGGQFHTLSLQGDIVNDQIHYKRFILNDQTVEMDITIAPIQDSVDDKLAVAIQLDGNAEETPYYVDIDNVNFIRSVVSIPDDIPHSPVIVIRNNATIRSCGSTTCNAIAGLQDGDMAPLIGTLDSGECISDNCMWYEITYFGATAYVHSSLATISDATIASAETICPTTGDRAIPVYLVVPQNHKTYIASSGIGTTSENIEYGGFLTIITGPYEGLFLVHNGIICDAVVVESAFERFSQAQTSQACSECTTIEISSDSNNLGDSNIDNDLTFNCTNTGDGIVEVQFDVPEGYMAAINSDGIGTSLESRRYGGYSTIITGPFHETLFIHTGVYCMVAAIGSADETAARARIQDACAGRVCTELNLPEDIAEIGG